MNHPHTQIDTKSLDQSILDGIELLVERELTDDACRELMSQVAQQPQYWKIMAVAFVEQQRMGRCIRDVAQSDGAVIAKPYSVPLTGTKRRPIPWASYAAIAASLLLLTIAVFSWLDPIGSKRAEVVPQISGSDASLDKVPDEVNLRPSKSLSVARNVAGYVEWPGEAGSKLLPVFHGLEVDAEWLDSHPVQLDKHMMDSLTRAGWQVNPSRRFVSIKLVDGEVYTIPVDDIRYRFVGRNVF